MLFQNFKNSNCCWLLWVTSCALNFLSSELIFTVWTCKAPQSSMLLAMPNKRRSRLICCKAKFSYTKCTYFSIYKLLHTCTKTIEHNKTFRVRHKIHTYFVCPRFSVRAAAMCTSTRERRGESSPERSKITWSYWHHVITISQDEVWYVSMFVYNTHNLRYVESRYVIMVVVLLCLCQKRWTLKVLFQVLIAF